MNTGLHLPLATQVAIAARQKSPTRYCVGYYNASGQWRGVGESDPRFRQALVIFQTSGQTSFQLDGFTWRVTEA
jgi:hypothetical protein